MSARMSRIPAPDAFTHHLDEEIPAGTEILDGTPTAAVAELGRVGGTDVGIWEMTPGVATDVESEELFVVLSGRATVTFAGDNGGERIEIGPGSVVSLAAGEHTTWTVHETLRKVYVALA